MSSQWKKFQFFQKEEVRLPKLPGAAAPAKQSLQSVRDTCADAGRGYLVLGDDEGLIHFIRGGFRWESFRAYSQRVTHVHQLLTKPVLVAVGDDTDANAVVTILRVPFPQELGEPPEPQPPSPIFKTANITKETSARVFEGSGGGDPDVTCVRASEDLQYIAVGLSNGSVVLFRGADLSTQTRFPPQTSSVPVTGLCFKFINPSLPTCLFAVTKDTVTTHMLYGDREETEVLSDQGCEHGCCAQSASDKNILAGRDDGVFIYTYDGGSCAPAGYKAFEGRKTSLISFTRYLLVAGVNDQDGSDVCNVYDLEHQFVAASNAFVGGVRRVFYEWDSVVVLTKDHRVFRLKERGTAEKIEKLITRNQFEVAADIAKSGGYERQKVSEIYRRFGDHQYEKGEYDSAMTQYLETIGHGVEPSYVIQRFLDAGGSDRIDNLVRYLQRLHELEEANADHTTLLLNCYTQMGKLDQLDGFIRQEGLHYDVETAITVCRQAGFYQQGLFLAKRHKRHSAWLKIQLDQDRGTAQATPSADAPDAVPLPGGDRTEDCRAALEYIRELPTFEEAKGAMMQYGRLLLVELPEETTEFLIQLCTGYTPPCAKPPPAATHPNPTALLTAAVLCRRGKPSEPDTHLESYIQIFLHEDVQKHLMVFLERAKEQHKQDDVQVRAPPSVPSGAASEE